MCYRVTEDYPTCPSRAFLQYVQSCSEFPNCGQTKINANPDQGGLMPYLHTVRPQFECPHCLRHVQNGFAPTPVYSEGTVLHHGLHEQKLAQKWSIILPPSSNLPQNAQRTAARNSDSAAVPALSAVEGENKEAETVKLGALNAEDTQISTAGSTITVAPPPPRDTLAGKQTKRGVEARKPDFQEVKSRKRKRAKIIAPIILKTKTRPNSTYSASTNTAIDSTPQAQNSTSFTSPSTNPAINSIPLGICSASTNTATNSALQKQNAIYFISPDTNTAISSIPPGQNTIYFTPPNTNTATNFTPPEQNSTYFTSPNTNTTIYSTYTNTTTNFIPPEQNPIYFASPDTNAATNSTLPGPNPTYLTSSEAKRRQNSVYSTSSDTNTGNNSARSGQDSDTNTTANSTPPVMWEPGSAFNPIEVEIGTEEARFNPAAWLPPTVGPEFNPISSNALDPQLFMDTARKIPRQVEPPIPSYY